MMVEPYLMFEGRTEEALEFYKRAIGAEVAAMIRFKDVPDAKDHTPPGAENKVMHSLVKVGSTSFMASDGFCSGKPDFKGVSLALSTANATAWATFATCTVFRRTTSTCTSMAPSASFISPTCENPVNR